MIRENANYKLGLTWWDFNNAGRKQSAWVSAIDGSNKKKILPVTVLPAYKDKGQLPGQQVLDLPAELINTGDLRVCIRKEAGSNAVIAKIWLERVNQGN